jgi:putative phage-type endonuclease
MGNKAMTKGIFIRNDALEQGSQEWHKWRSSVIGASDAPVIMQESPWKSRESLLKEKLGEIAGFKGNAATRKGSQLEPMARSIYRNFKKIEVSPTVVQSVLNPWQAASLDGIDLDNLNLVEIKCGEKSHIFTTRTGKVPSYYYAQLQHILAVTGLQSIDYFSYHPNTPPILIKVDRDEKYIEKLHKSELDFAYELARRGYLLQGMDKNINLKSNQEKISIEKYQTSVSNGHQVGELINGLMNGLGYVRHKSGGFYVGQWLENHPNGKGIQAWGEDSKWANHWYLGDIKNNIRDGEGTYIWPDGKKYIGSWSRGMQEGNGVLIELNGDVYIGNFSNGKKHGFGRLNFSSGITYIGDWSQDFRHGKGKTIFHDGSFFEGEYKNDVIDGYGLEMDGSINYEGEYKNGFKEGYGKLRINEGRIYEGNFKKDKFEGKGYCKWPDGSSFKGEWNLGEPDGVGLFTSAFGAAYEGLWRKGFSSGLLKSWIKNELVSFNEMIENIEDYLLKLRASALDFNDLLNRRASQCELENLLNDGIEISEETMGIIIEFKRQALEKLIFSHQGKVASRPYCCNQDGYENIFHDHLSNMIEELVPSAIHAINYCLQFKNYDLQKLNQAFEGPYPLRRINTNQ